MEFSIHPVNLINCELILFKDGFTCMLKKFFFSFKEVMLNKIKYFIGKCIWCLYSLIVNQSNGYFYVLIVLYKGF